MSSQVCHIAAGDRQPLMSVGRLVLVGVMSMAALSGCGRLSGQFDADAVNQYRQCLKRSSKIYRSRGDFSNYIRKVGDVARDCGISSSTVDRSLYGLRADDGRDKIASRKLTIKRQVADVPGADGTSTAYRRRGNAVRDYLNRLITPGFVARGRKLMARHQEVLQEIESEYGVPAHYLVAYWGIETRYGAYSGRHAVIPTLAKRGYRSSRRRFFSSELLGALLIVDRGYARRSQMYGSFAGAMGQPQFMPSSYTYFAVDHDGDGRRDIWRTPADVFASIANYNIDRGRWNTRIKSAIYEVRLPGSLRLTRTGFYKLRALNEWRRDGVRGVGGRFLPDSEEKAAIYMPAGCGGPVFLLPGNFRAIMRYNNLIEYAFAVSVLAEKIRGGFEIRKRWPYGDYALAKWQRADLQRRLSRKGYGRLKADGILGRKSRLAIQRYQKREGLCPSGHANTRLYRHIRGKRGRGYADATQHVDDQRAEANIR